MKNITCPVCDNRKTMIGVECSDCQWPNYPVLGEKGDYYFAEIAKAKEIFKDKCELRKLKEENQQLQLELEKEKLQREQNKLLAEKEKKIYNDKCEVNKLKEENQQFQIELEKEKLQREQVKLLAEKEKQAELERIEKQQKKRACSLIHKGKDFTIPNLGMEFVFIEDGSFQMGSNSHFEEQPIHHVTISNYFWLGKFQVTQAEYKEINNNECSSNTKPIGGISWNDAVEFCKKLTEREQKSGRLPADYNYRLPTEAEWEYCAKGGNKSQDYKYSGSNNIDNIAWTESNSNGKSHVVGKKSPNELGIYDMSGNVFEWCNDWYGKYYYEESPATDPKGVSNGTCRVFRGGNYFSYSGKCRSAYRDAQNPSFKSEYYGFRVLLVQEERNKNGEILKKK